MIGLAWLIALSLAVCLASTAKKRRLLGRKERRRALKGWTLVQGLPRDTHRQPLSPLWLACCASYSSLPMHNAKLTKPSLSAEMMKSPLSYRN